MTSPPTSLAPRPADRALAALPWLGVTLALLFLWKVGLSFSLQKHGAFLRELAAVLLIAVGALAWRKDVLSSKTGRAAIVAGLLLVCTVAMMGHNRSEVMGFGTERQLQSWGVFHYYLGSKYFDELGYHDLYEQVLIADRENTKRLVKVKRLRDLKTYRTKKSGYLKKRARSDRFTDARWAEFQEDLDWLLRRHKSKYWAGVVLDRGYNPSPAYNAIVSAITNTFSVTKAFDRTVLASLDVLLIFLAFLLSCRAFGFLRSLLVLTAFIVWPGNERRIFGQIWIFDWFAACWAATAAWRLGWAKTAGALVGYATLMRVFPGVLFVGPFILGVHSLIKHRTVERKTLELLGTGAAVGLLLIVVGGTHSVYGFDAWSMFAENTAHHSTQHKYGARRVGLEHITALDFGAGLVEQPVKGKHRKTMEANKPLLRAMQLVFLALLVVAVLRSNRYDAFVLGSIVLFFGTVASRYYGSLWVMLLLLGIDRGSGTKQPEPRALRLMVLETTLFVMFWVGYAFPVRVAESWLVYMWFNILLMFWFLAVLIVQARNPAGPVEPVLPEGDEAPTPLNEPLNEPVSEPLSEPIAAPQPS